MRKTLQTICEHLGTRRIQYHDADDRVSFDILAWGVSEKKLEKPTVVTQVHHRHER